MSLNTMLYCPIRGQLKTPEKSADHLVFTEEISRRRHYLRGSHFLRNVVAQSNRARSLTLTIPETSGKQIAKFCFWPLAASQRQIHSSQAARK